MLYKEEEKPRTIEYQSFTEKDYMPFPHKHYATKSIHEGQAPEKVFGSVNVPIHASSTFAQHKPSQPYDKFDYSRCGNPTRNALEECLAACHYAKFCITFSSGCAATTALLELVKSGEHVVVCDDVYGGTNRLLNKIFIPNHGIKADFVDMTDLAKVEAAIRPETKLVWIETPTNPTLKVVDVQAVAAIARKHGAVSVCDCTFDSPFLLSPLLLGVDIAYDSLTKYVNGHSDLVMGSVCLNSPQLYQRIYLYAKSQGGCPSVFDSYLCLRGHRTLSVRVREATKNAFHIAHYLETHPLVEKVVYPGLKSHPQHEIARKQMRGFGAMITFYVKGEYKHAEAFLSHLKVFTLAESLGGVESLAQHPGKMTHASVPAEQRKLLGISDTLIRMSIGIEDLDDLIEDINSSLLAAHK